MEGHGDARTGVVVHARLEAPMEQHRKPRKMRKWVVAGIPLATAAGVFGVRTAAAGGFGIAGLDAFLTTFATGVTGLGLVIGGVGLAGYVGSLMDNPFSTILSGSINFFTKAGILGGGTGMLWAAGVVAGGPLWRRNRGDHETG